MAAKKTPTKKAASNNAPAKVGRPSKFDEGMREKIRQLCILGATDADSANFLDISISTLSNWKVEKPEFLEALKAAKSEADARVERSLYERAMGYEHDEVDIRVIANQIVQTPIRKKYPPDTTAAIFWLKNRKPVEWRDKVENIVSGPNGGPVQHSLEVSFVKSHRAA